MDFRFLDPGPLIDRELGLVAPDARWLDDFLDACAHPQSRGDALASSFTRQKVLDFLRAAPGGHHHGYASAGGSVPIYSFWMRLSRPPRAIATERAPEPEPVPEPEPEPEQAHAIAAASQATGSASEPALGLVRAPVPGSGPAAAPHVSQVLPTWGDVEPPVRIAGTVGLRIGTTRELELYYGHVGYNVFPPARGNHYAERACRLLLPLARAHGMRTLWITCNPENLASRRTCERLGCELIDIVRVPPGHALYLRGEREKCRYRLELCQPERSQR